MNFYFLLEDEKSFLKVLPSWLEYMDFGCTRVADIQEVETNNYVMQSGQGVTQLVTKVIFDTIDTIKDNPGKIDKLVVILDAEELEIEERKQDLRKKIKEKYGDEIFGFEIVILVCNRCFETWLLGCVGLYPEDVEVESDFYEYYKHFNIEKDDPEVMQPSEGSRGTTAKYHFHYLHELLRYKRIRYSKNRPQYVGTKEYFDGIVRRIDTTEHLQTFKEFYEFLATIKGENDSDKKLIRDIYYICDREN